MQSITSPNSSLITHRLIGLIFFSTNAATFFSFLPIKAFHPWWPWSAFFLTHKRNKRKATTQTDTDPEKKFKPCKKKQHRSLQCSLLQTDATMVGRKTHQNSKQQIRKGRISENTRKEEEKKIYWSVFPILSMSLCVSQFNGWFMVSIVKRCNWPPCLLPVWKWEQEWSRDVSGLVWTFCQCWKILRQRWRMHKVKKTTGG